MLSFKNVVAVAIASAVVSLSAPAHAAAVVIVGGAPQTPVASFDLTSDIFSIVAETFGVSAPLSFQNILASGGNVSDSANVIVVQNTASTFNARTAVQTIAANTGADRPGFFVYFNTGLSIDRLVFAANLNDPNSVLQILAAIQSPTGADALSRLSQFSAANFRFVETPLPAAAPLFLGALAAFGVTARRKGRS